MPIIIIQKNSAHSVLYIIVNENKISSTILVVLIRTVICDCM